MRTIDDLVNLLYKDMESKIDPWMMPNATVSKNIKYLPDPPEYDLLPEKYDREFFWHMGFKLKNSVQISSKQADLLVKLLRKYKNAFVMLGLSDQVFNEILNNRIFLVEPYKSSIIEREVRYLGDNILAFRFKYNPKILDELKRIKSKRGQDNNKIYFNSEYKLWIACIDEKNISDIMKLIKSFSFNFDKDVELFFLDSFNNSEKNVELLLDNDKCKITVFNDKIFSDWLSYEIRMEEVYD